MKDFPEFYDDKKIKAMYEKLALPEETVTLLDNYFKAFSNLYGIITLREAYKIIDSQNEGLISEDKFLEYAEIVRYERRHHHSVLAPDELYDDIEAGDISDRQIVTEYLTEIDMDSYYDMAKSQEGLPFFVPQRDELLKYEDEYYYEKNSYSSALTEFMKKLVGEEKAEETVFECISWVEISDSNDNPYEEVLSNLHKMMSVDIPDPDFSEFMELFTELFNNIRLRRFRGHTLTEICKMKGIPFPEYPIPDYDEIKKEMTFREATAPLRDFLINYEIGKNGKYHKKKIGRNDPCPCGSGKKYKKCCGR